MLATSQIMSIMLVQYIHVAWANLIDIAVHIFNLTFTRYAITGFQVIAVVQQRLSASTHNGMADGITHSVFFRQ